MPKKIFLIACEASGDSHAAHLVKELRNRIPGAEFRGLGGPKMASSGVSLLQDMTKISALGLGDVIRQYFTYRKIFYEALNDVKRWQPDVVVLVDSPAFNLRFAKKLKNQTPKVPIVYYISPQIWAWGGRRIHTIKKIVSQMLCILPFEISLYEKAGVPCEFVGHPLLDQVKISPTRNALRQGLGISNSQKAIGLLPGSRQSEVRRILPIMLKAASHLQQDLPDALFFIAESGNVEKTVYEEILRSAHLQVQRFSDHFYEHIAAMDFALVTSGTATLETALAGTPFFLLYKTSWTTYFLGKHLIRVPYLGIVNLLAGKKVVPEFIQQDAHPETIAHEARVLLENEDLYGKMKQEFLEVRKKLGEGGASARAARAVMEFLKKK